MDHRVRSTYLYMLSDKPYYFPLPDFEFIYNYKIGG